MADPLADPMADRRLKAAFVSLVVSLLVLALKLWAWQATHSAAVLADALESIVNVVAAALAGYSIWLSAKPADRNHPYGHGKAEDFSAGVEGALVVLAGGAILFHTFRRFGDPVPLEELGLGLGLVTVASVLNLLLGAWLVRQGRELRSRALEADGQHVLSDVLSSGASILGLLLVHFTGLVWLDALAAGFIGLHVLGAGIRLVRGSVARLMDEADEDLLESMCQQLSGERPEGWIDVHQLRAWRSGDFVHVDLHLSLPRYWDLEQGHREQHAMEERLLAGVAGSGEVIVHQDPCKPMQCPACAVRDCPVRSETLVTRPKWDRDHLVSAVAVPAVGPEPDRG